MELNNDEYRGGDIGISSMKNFKNILYNDENKLKIVVMLYDGCITYLKNSIDFIKKGDTVRKNIYTEKARKIINELENSLILIEKSKISEDLKILYSFLNGHLSEAALNNNIDAFNDVINMLGTLKESWEHLDRSLAKRNN